MILLYGLMVLKLEQIHSLNVPIGLIDLILMELAVNDFHGKTKEIAYYDEILTDAELETLTSYRSLNEMVIELNLNAL